MSKYPFGKTVTREFYPLRDVGGLSEPFAVSSITAYLYEDRPSRDDAQAGTGAMHTGVSFTYQTDSPFTVTYQFPAVDDPDPFRTQNYEPMVEVINAILENGEQIQTTLRPLIFERAQGAPEIPGTTTNTIKDVFPQIANYLDDDKLAEMLLIVEEQIKIELKSNGIQWAQVQNLRVLKLALAYRCIAMASISQIAQQGDRHDRRQALFQELYDSTMKAVRLEIDTDEDGEIDNVAAARPSHFVITK